MIKMQKKNFERTEFNFALTNRNCTKCGEQLREPGWVIYENERHQFYHKDCLPVEYAKGV